MQIKLDTSISFTRRLTSSEKNEYIEILNKGKSIAANGDGKSLLICPITSLPQNIENNTGIGNLASDESQNFIDMAKTYWGINGIQILPVGQYHSHNGEYPIYSGTSMDLGNHVIDLKSFVSPEDFKKVAESNRITDRVNFENVVEPFSPYEKALKNSYKNITPQMQQEFNVYKKEMNWLLEPKALYRALREINGNYNYNEWNNIDRNLFDDRIISPKERENRLKEIYNSKFETIDFYKFKQFLAEKSLTNSKRELNNKGIKLYGDMLCGFSYDEVWAKPKAFLKDSIMDWGLPAMDFESKEAEELLRKKVSLYAKRFDGFRVDASWAYISPKITNKLTGNVIRKYYGDKFLNIIDEEVKKVKGKNFDLSNIMHEFAANAEDFSLYDDYRMKPEVADRMKIYTSDWLSEDWGGASPFKKRGWNADKFIIGATSHDSPKIKVDEAQADTLSKILNIPKKKLLNLKEFIKAKLAEPISAKNNFIFFMQALGLDGQYSKNADFKDNYKMKIPSDFEVQYHKKLQSGEGFNPMDALEKQFKAQGLDKKEPELFKKIVKYRKILEQKEGNSYKKVIIMSVATILLSTLVLIYKKCSMDLKKYQ